MAEFGSIRAQWKSIRMSDAEASDFVDSPTPEADGNGPATRRTFVNSGARFEGTLSLRGDFAIDTEFEGAIETDGRITIGSEGSVVGDLRASEVVIRGAVVGNVTAARQVIVEAAARLHGDIETAALEIQKGAFFRGTTRMTQPLMELRDAAAQTEAASFAPTPA